MSIRPNDPIELMARCSAAIRVAMSVFKSEDWMVTRFPYALTRARMTGLDLSFEVTICMLEYPDVLKTRT
jgi:hypothetical protein